MIHPRPRRRLLLGAAVAVVGVVLVAAGLTHLHHPAPRQPAKAFGAAPAGPSSGATQPSIRDASPTVSRAPSTSRLADGSGVPQRVRIARLHVDAPVVPVPSQNGAITVPTSPTVLGWWVAGASPGAAVGSTVIVGHVDSAASGPGALFHLDRVRPGDTVAVRVTGGIVQDYRVSALRIVHKSMGLTARQLGVGSRSPGLVLVTCGGPFDETTKSYQDNIVAFARPVD
ncbi:class F sortase [uncultured Jatrophihabitans sp.]|uniref:class F sortase n=1 Tax=uncultured Jatrophihabitans sp. TaxID=1610747 RepID=UPI0035CB721D